MRKVHVFKIVDKNAFDRVLIERAFSLRDDGIVWADRQIDLIKQQFRAQGEDLLDIEYEATMLDLDKQSILGGWRRPS